LVLAVFAGLLWLPKAGEKTSIQVHISEITDAVTGEPVRADIYVTGEQVASGVSG